MSKKAQELFGKLRHFAGGVYLAQNQGIFNDLFKDIGAKFGAGEGSLAKSQTVGNLIFQVVQILLLVAGSIAVIYLVVGGYQYIMARGNEEKTETARKTITSAIVGLVVIILAFAIITMVANILLKKEGLGI